MSDRATKLYEQALASRETPVFRRFLCYAYGLMSRRMTQGDLDTLEMDLKELEGEYNEPHTGHTEPGRGRP